jgi:hypothetical protein
MDPIDNQHTSYARTLWQPLIMDLKAALEATEHLASVDLPAPDIEEHDRALNALANALQDISVWYANWD